MELNTIYNIDCLKGLRELKDNSIDVIITSPPYNKTGLNGERSLKNRNISNLFVIVVAHLNKDFYA